MWFSSGGGSFEVALDGWIDCVGDNDVFSPIGYSFEVDLDVW